MAYRRKGRRGRRKGGSRIRRVTLSRGGYRL